MLGPVYDHVPDRERAFVGFAARLEIDCRRQTLELALDVDSGGGPGGGPGGGCRRGEGNGQRHAGAQQGQAVLGASKFGLHPPIS